MLGNPQLRIKVEALPLLLPGATARSLCDRFLRQISSDMREWLDRTLSQEKDVREASGFGGGRRG